MNITGDSMNMSISEHCSREAGVTCDQIQEWLIRTVAAYLKVDAQEVKIDMHFDGFGLDSVDAVSISGALGDWLRRELPVTLLFEYPTIRVLSAHLASPAAK